MLVGIPWRGASITLLCLFARIEYMMLGAMTVSAFLHEQQYSIPIHSLRTRLQPPTRIRNDKLSSLDNDEMEVTLSYEGQSCKMLVRRDESILSALERQSYLLGRHIPSLPTEIPSDCRRGNCLTCAARIGNTINSNNMNNGSTSTSEYTRIIQKDDGLSPAMTELVAKKGYILTCSTMVQQSGLQVELGVNHALWKELYASPGRFTTDEAQLVARSAMAKVIRKYNERNLQQWTEGMEELIQEKKQ